MSIAAGYFRNAAAFTRPSPLLRVELTMENRNFRPVSDRGIPPTHIDQVTPSPPGSRSGAYPPPTPCTRGGWGELPPLCCASSDGGFYVQSLNFLCKWGVPTPPMP